MTAYSLYVLLSQFPALCEGCTEVMCSTCGGLGRGLARNMTPDLKKCIDEKLDAISLEDFRQLGDWREWLSRCYNREKVCNIFERTLAELDASSPRDLDCILIGSRRLFCDMPGYQRCLQLGITKAIETQDESLIETLVICLGENLLQHPALYAMALEKMKVVTGIHRALYNAVRTQVDDVRYFVGDGTSVPY